ncbi:hypothetical protein PALB_13930 [Pseudoalteromonas luteoviolacea B = ATCC 29581]|nr:hypothetical protein PALB_13930 [Pseudoalteromonas luteoviolacea B = ATCC 29581]
MELIERYVYAVKTHLPEQHRDEIGRELKAALLDEIDELSNPADDKQISDVLERWGDPRKVAAQYAPPKALVSGEFMPIFWSVVKSVLLVLFTIHTIKFGLALVSVEHFNPISFVIKLVMSFMSTAVYVFGIVTLIFYALSCESPTLSWLEKSAWRIGQLPKITASWQHIKGIDIATDFATAVFLITLVQPAWWMSEAGHAAMLIDFTPQVKAYALPATVLFSASVVFCLWQALQPTWDKRKLAINMALNSLYCVVLFGLMMVDKAIVAKQEPLVFFMNEAFINRNVQVVSGILMLVNAYFIFRDIKRFKQVTN